MAKARSGLQVGSTITSKLLSCEISSCHFRLSIGSSVVHIKCTLDFLINSLAHISGLSKRSLHNSQTSGAVFSLKIPLYPK